MASQHIFESAPPIGHHQRQGHVYTGPPAVNSAIGEYNAALQQQEEATTGPDTARSSDSSSRTIGDDGDGPAERIHPDELRRRRSEELGEPSEARLGQAAMTGAIGAQQGSAGRETLLGGVNARPRGHGETAWDDKHGFWAPELKKKRRAAFKKGAFVYTFITCWLWICLSIFWGSTYKLEANLKNLRVDFVTFDNDAGSVLNQPMRQAVEQQQQLGSTPHLGWVIRDANEYPNGLESVRRDIIGQECWVTVVINANATSAWRSALQNGNANYNPSGAVGVYYASARFYQVTLLYVNALIVEFLETPLQEARQQAYRDFVTSTQLDGGALARARQVPQAVGTAFSYTIQDLRSIPNYAWSAAAPMEASLIYFVIFAFYVAFYGAIARMKTGLAGKLKFGSFVGIRIAWPLIAYFFLSLWQTLVVQAFQAPLYDYLGRAGFVVFWALNFVTIIAGGFAMETVVSLLGPQWLPVFLVLWLIMNITSSFFPLELMPRFYQFFHWGIFLHNVEAFKIIAFGTNFVSRLGYHFGILFAVIGVECICYPLAIFFQRWKMDRGIKRAEKEKEHKAREGKKEGA